MNLETLMKRQRQDENIPNAKRTKKETKEKVKP